MHFARLSAVLIAGLTFSAAQLPKNGGLTDERPTYDNPEDAVYKAVEPKLKTRWTDGVANDPENAWVEYPRPLLRRDKWLNLNGVWQFQAAGSASDVSSPPFNKTLNQRVLVPYCIESGLSGIAQQFTWMWYRKTFELSDEFDENIILHFAAVDYEATVFVNGQEVGKHTGGYDKFAIDITSNILRGASNEILVFVYDPTDGQGENIPIGKQRIWPSHIFYTPCSGIWQTVSLEAVPASEYITNLDFRAEADGKVNAAITTTAESSTPASISVLDPEDNSKVIFQVNGTTNGPFEFTVEDAKTWTPDSPNLYNITIVVGNDTVTTYVGFRTVERKTVNGHERLVLNGKPIFIFGPLDQGLHPDGIHSPASNEAMVFDIKYLKGLGMNLIRKHIKVEPDLFYYACDQLGMIVMQDMPALNIAGVNDAQQSEWERQLKIMVHSHLKFPSVLAFVIYNEGWGQLGTGPEDYLTDQLREIIVGHQVINAVSGWSDSHQRSEGRSIGDFHDNHHYSSPQCGTPFSSLASTPYDPKRIGFQGEFGGVGINTTIEHLWNDFEAIRDIPQTYEIDIGLDVWNYRALKVIEELREQTELYKNCNGGVYTQTTDVEGEVNGFLTYDRSVDRVDRGKWVSLIQALHETFEGSI